MIYSAAYSAYLFLKKFFGYNIHSLGGVTKLFWLVLWVADAAYSAIKLFFFIIEFSTCFIP